MGRTPIIGYDNLLEQGTITADGTDEENAFDWRTDDAWTTGAASGYIITNIGASVPCDYLAVCGHTLATRSATIKLQYWTGADYADIPEATYTPSSDVAFMILFPSISSTRFKVVVTTDGTAATLAVISFGARLELQRGLKDGYSPPRFSKDDRYYNAITVGGHLGGRAVISTGISGALTITDVDSDWARVDLDPFLTDAAEQGWFLLWSPDGYPTECAYCMTTETPRPAEYRGGRASCSISYVGVTE